MSSHRNPQLSKSRFTAGLQCLKRLYLECYHRELADPPEEVRQAIFDTGNAVGELARQRFPNGRLIAEQYYEHSQAVETTKALLADNAVPPLYEAAFTFQGIRTRVDILRQSGTREFEREFDLVEVKSSTSVKSEHISDVAIQLYSVEGSGLPVKKAYLMHLNKGYVYPGGPHNLEQLFILEDVAGAARSLVAESLPGNLERMEEALQQDAAPDIETGRHCRTPYRCPFYGHCHQNEPEHPIAELPRLSEKAAATLAAAGIRDIGSIPPDFGGLSPTQQRVQNSVATGRPFISPNLAVNLAGISLPASFLDFETFGPAIPLYVGTRPYQVIPFQWSLHLRDSAERLSHRSFLNSDAGDPRERFVTSLLESIPSEGSIMTYSNYEETVIKGLAREFPQYEGRLLALCGRLFDLLKVIRDGYYHPEFHGSYSIKSALPALVPDLDYSDLEIAGGSVASLNYFRLIDQDTPESDKVKITEALHNYCKRDTEAMVRIYDALRIEAGSPGGSG